MFFKRKFRYVYSIVCFCKGGVYIANPDNSDDVMFFALNSSNTPRNYLAFSDKALDLLLFVKEKIDFANPQLYCGYV